MNIGYKPLNIQELKKSILHETLDYNIREQEVKSMKKNMEREKQIEEYQRINEKAIEQLNLEKEKQINKRYYIRNILSQEYEKQMRERKMLDVEEKRRNRSYAHAAEQNQKEYHEKRARELARIYRAQKSLQTINPEYQSQLSKHRIVTEGLSSDQKYAQQIYPKKYSTPHTQMTIQQTPKSYKDYLKQQIDRKKLKKQEQTRNRLQIQKELAKYNSRLLAKQQQELREIQRRQQQVYKIGLDQQVAQKKSFNSFHF